MNYLYTSVNRLLEPHSYMYSPYAGEEFLQSYLADRVERLFSITASTPKVGSPLEDRSQVILHTLLDGSKGDFPPSNLAHLFHKPNLAFEYTGQILLPITFPNADTLDTDSLLDALLASLLDRSSDSNCKSETMLWVDRLSQRFEVRKKLFSRYFPGFRRGDGADDNIHLYKKLALLLALAYAGKGKLNHLSTLLKVNDLLLSLPHYLHEDYKTECSVILSVAVEIYGVLLCAQNQKIDLHF